MIATKGVYDPVKAVEGMFNGSVTRIAYALKDPINYGGSTKTVLAECAKRFQDALDDCEIQLLDAKWYLENQLRTNQLRREAQAREMGTAAKRKHDEIKEINETTTNSQSTAKKAKLDQDQVKISSEELTKPKDSSVTDKPIQDQGNSDTKSANEQPTVEKKDEQKKSDTAPQSTSKPTEALKPDVKEPSSISAQDDFAKPTPPASTAGTNEDFNFETMFGEPTGGDEDMSKIENELDFFSDTKDFADAAEDGYNQDSLSLDKLLPGVETYANQLDDNPAGKQISSKPGNPDTSALPTLPNDFGLPDIGESNIFDELFHEDGMGVASTFDPDLDPNDTSVINIDFDFP